MAPSISLVVILVHERRYLVTILALFFNELKRCEVSSLYCLIISSEQPFDFDGGLTIKSIAT